MRARNAETIGMEVVVALDRPPGRRVVQRQPLRLAVRVADDKLAVVELRLHRMGRAGHQEPDVPCPASQWNCRFLGEVVPLRREYDVGLVARPRGCQRNALRANKTAPVARRLAKRGIVELRGEILVAVAPVAESTQRNLQRTVG